MVRICCNCNCQPCLDDDWGETDIDVCGTPFDESEVEEDW